MQRLTSAAGAADASTAPSTVASNNAGGSRARRRDNDRQEHLQQATLVVPLVASTDKLATVHECMGGRRASERRQGTGRAIRRSSIVVG